ncbi:glycosyl transferase family 39 [Denitrovibrio acetiphilus DSM 12809]|uniref:Glycosyl transferase family 39 n=1 Tax=Denitrovibrio acetiphilus (strain DSM 12809 / NBRC 114555 / N2460) TaxID=522772 RepID=D4H405_DENA2|nr:glycosyltransferase family 39 protein [Denitrovibrio acetiphilus]ADD67316.1 glycosyl transferase family 39 [Denitrovibrio acetiphilus DSM 12809]
MRFNKGFWWLMLLVTSLFGAHMVNTDLRGDSMNYAAISNNILHGNNPLILTLNDNLYMNKPPLFFWVNALFIKFFGATPFSVKLSTLLAALAVTFFLYKIIKEILKDERSAVIAPFLFFTTYIVYKNTHMLKLETFVSAFMLGAVYFYLRFIKDKGSLNLILVSIFSGLAVFSKGALGVVPVAAMFVFPVFCKNLLTFSYYSKMLLVAVLTVVIPGWWFWYIIGQTPFFETFFISQMLDRVGDNAISMSGTTYFRRPVWAYLIYILKYGGLFIVLFPYGLYRLKKDGKINTGVKFMLTLAVMYTVVIHFITTREQRYLYQFYMFFWFAGAYGVSVLIKKNYTPFLKYVSIGLLLFLVIYPGDLNWSTYGVLMDVNRIAEKNDIKVVAREPNLTDKSDKAAMSFYLRGYSSSPAGLERWIEVTDKHHRLNDGDLLYSTRRILVYLMRSEGAN